jgi:uncharacterized protein YdhG (YjbR/CyaY superfamily)
VTPDVQAYVEGIAPEHRPLFDRVRALVLDVAPGAVEKLSYGMPTYVVGRRKLSLGAWKHGLSVYGWGENRDGGFLAAHPELRTSKGTIQIRPGQAEQIDDRELRALVGAVLAE